jgi:hypothetical protein
MPPLLKKTVGFFVVMSDLHYRTHGEMGRCARVILRGRFLLAICGQCHGANRQGQLANHCYFSRLYALTRGGPATTSRARALAKRDITVPTGTLDSFAVSL